MAWASTFGVCNTCASEGLDRCSITGTSISDERARQASTLSVNMIISRQAGGGAGMRRQPVCDDIMLAV